MAIVQAVLIFTLPGLAIFLASRFRFIEWIGPVVMCYFLGIVLGNLPWTLHAPVVNTTTEVTVVLALPLLLFSADIRGWFRLAPRTLLSFALMLISAVTSAGCTIFFLRHHVQDSWKIAGMLVGMYSGGAANTSAIGKALEVPNETFLLLTSADVILGGAYLFIVLSVGQRICLMFLPAFSEPKEGEAPLQLDLSTVEKEQLVKGQDSLVFSRFSERIQMGIAIVFSVGVVGLSAGASFVIYGKLQPTFVILLLTTLGLLCSLWKPIQNLKLSYEAGDYLLLVFCVAIGALVDFQKMFASSAVLTFFGFACCLMLGAILLHMFLAYCFGIDADTALITSVAGIFGPPFIGPVASALNNRQILVSGLTMGIAGLALGTQLGLLFSYVVKMWSGG